MPTYERLYHSPGTFVEMDRFVTHRCRDFGMDTDRAAGAVVFERVRDHVRDGLEKVALGAEKVVLFSCFQRRIEGVMNADVLLGMVALAALRVCLEHAEESREINWQVVEVKLPGLDGLELEAVDEEGSVRGGGKKVE